MGRWSDTLFDDGEPQLIEAQSPVVRPAPIPQPSPVEQPMPRVPAQRAPVQRFPAPAPLPLQEANPPRPVEATPPMPSRRWSDETFSVEPQQPSQPSKPAEAPRKEGWGEWAYNTVAGRKDPAYAGIPSFEQAMLGENNENALFKPRLAAPFAATDTGLGNIIQGSLGDRFIRQETDKNGYPVIVYKGPDGKEAKAYVNRPGLDTEDIGRGIMQAVPYVLGGGAMGAVAKGFGNRVIGMAGTAGLTSMGGDLVAMGMGSQETPDPVRASLIAATAGGAELAAPAISAVWRKFVTEPSLFKNGALTPKGQAAAQQAGLDPADLTQELAQSFSKEFARTGDALRSGTTAQTREFGIPVTRGQLTKDPQQLLTEKAARHTIYGDTAKGIMDSFDKQQKAAIAAAAIGDDTARVSVANTIAPGRYAKTTPAAIGEELKTGAQEAQKIAKQNENFMWGRVGKLEATDAAKAELPDVITQRVGSMAIDENLTPKAVAMIRDIEGFVAGKTPGIESSILKRQSVQDVGDMRKRLLGFYKGAEKEDVGPAKAIYDGFNEWIESSAQKALLSGNPASAVAMRQARDVTKEMKSIFGEYGSDGAATPGRRVIQSLLDDGTTPETIVSKLFSTDPGATPKAGTQEALQLMKRGLDRYLPPDRATAVWNDVRLAAWQKLVMRPTGDLHTPEMMAQNVEKFFRSQQTIARTLYAPEEQKLMRRFGQAMREIAYKDPNPSGTATANAVFSKQFLQTFMRVVGAADGPFAKIASFLMGWSGVTNQVGKTVATSAVSGGVMPTARPALGQYGGAAGSQVDTTETRNALFGR